MKGQAYNIVQCLKHSVSLDVWCIRRIASFIFPDRMKANKTTDRIHLLADLLFSGPLELTRRQKVLVWDDEVEVEDDTITELFNAPLTASPRASVRTMPLPSPIHRRSQSFGAAGGFPPPMQRRSTDATGALRPVPFSTKLPRVHPGTTGVTILEHMERVDAVEAGLRRLGPGIDDFIEEEDETEEVDVGMAGPSSLQNPTVAPAAEHTENPFESETPSSPKDETDEPGSLANSVTEEDLVALSRSTPHMQVSISHQQWRSDSQQQGSAFALDWMRQEELEGVKKRVMIVEVCSMFRPFFSWKTNGDIMSFLASRSRQGEAIIFLLVNLYPNTHTFYGSYAICLQMFCDNQTPSR